MDRKYLRKKIVDQLKSAQIAGILNDVFSQRSIPSNIEALPLALVYIKDISVDRFDEAPKRYLNTAQVIIEIITTHDDDCKLADEMDDLSASVENVIETYGLDDELEDLELSGIQYGIEGDGQSPIGSVKINYNMSFITEPMQDIKLPDFNQVNATWGANGNENNDAQDEINLPGA